ncbi:hypothetical protein NDU88_005080 [Pleurodeles waltl]|uniref:Uncharacterized protein n=1 Tax=Pleurodeles waltl TaxID=8319 RepID=A0AAV7UJY8_PLEWA|nr:hypothetical protein NDU88_005080 [Pleurodeles waltl]
MCRCGSLDPGGISPASRDTGVQGSPSPPQTASNRAASAGVCEKTSKQTSKTAGRAAHLGWQAGRQGALLAATGGQINSGKDDERCTGRGASQPLPVSSCPCTRSPPTVPCSADRGASQPLPAGLHPCTCSSPTTPCSAAQLRTTRYSDVQRPMSVVPTVLPLSNRKLLLLATRQNTSTFA